MRATSKKTEKSGDVAELAAQVEPAPALRLASSKVTRGLSLVALLALSLAVVATARGAYRALTDAWVAPMQLSPESREVVTLRMQAAKEREQRARLESEIAGASAEIAAIDVSLSHLRTLADGYSNALRWSKRNRDDQLVALAEQQGLLEKQRAMAIESAEREKVAVERARHNVEAGIITAVEVGGTENSLVRTQLTRAEKELEYLRAHSAVEEAAREARALAEVLRRPSGPGGRRPLSASPDVVRLDEVRVNIALQIARLDAEKRTAAARARAANAGIESIDELRSELEATPLFVATKREIDLAFVPYAHLRKVRDGNEVYTCSWFLVGCRTVGRIKQIFPGEVVMDDPWGAVARGRYVELEMSDRSAVAERSLRVRHSVTLHPYHAHLASPGVP